MLQAEWFRYYHRTASTGGRLLRRPELGHCGKAGAANSYSVCTTWLIVDREYYLLDVFDRVTYPALRDMAVALAEHYKPRHILIEDAMTGSALAEELKKRVYFAVELIKPEGEKQVRLYVQQAKFEQGRVWFPKQAPWLRTFLEELLSFRIRDILTELTASVRPSPTRNRVITSKISRT